ncbi:Ni/Fe hydrogenase subunit alpha [Rhabdothermincola sp.]|uniref:Ni/Fe hydrogenase subunit alpha n=1 Tax=Rhabdothermincola sp. TaxID=2820405 RepID=UPI002FE1D6C4
MTHRAPAGRTLKVDSLARVEGEGALYIETVHGQVADVQLRIYEPPRFFEAFLRGRSYLEPPDITARICGICPVAYQMSACRAIEDACGVVVDGPLELLRRILYAGEWIESHTLHIYLLHAPDFFGLDSAVQLAERDRPSVERGLRLKKAGNQLIEFIGGRAIHPVNVRVGGFHRVPTSRELQRLRPGLERARDDALATVEWVAGFEFPDAGHDYTFVSVREHDRYPVLGGRVVSNRGLDISEAEFLDRVTEEQVEHSNALHATLDGDHYLCGALARYSLNHDRLRPAASDAARRAGLGATCTNPFRSIVVRAVEVLHACEEALAAIDAYEEPDTPALPVEPRAGVGHAATEAPRGLLYHRYVLEEDGTIADAVIVPPTSQNQPTIEHDLWHLVEDNLALDDEALTRRCEMAIRNHDPCISCATHFLELERVDR